MPNAPDNPAAELRARLGEGSAAIAAIEQLFDGLASAERVATARSLHGGALRRLWDAAAGHRPFGLLDLVPASVPALTAVRHYGRNSMPAFTIFEKRFYRAEAADAAAPGELYGANFQTFSPVTGPGYFVAHTSAERPELCLDYTRLPARAPAGWPAIRSNERGVTRLVYGFMLDWLRGVSQHVSIGSAMRNGRELGTYFILCREQPAPAGTR